MPYGDEVLNSIMQQVQGAQARFGGGSTPPRLLPFNPNVPMPAGLPPIGAAAPAALPAGPVVPPSAAQRIGFGAGRTARFLGLNARTGPALAIGAMGMGMANQADITEAGATPENRAERALQILSGADITGIGSFLGNKLAGRTEAPLPGFTAPRPAARVTPEITPGPFGPSDAGDAGPPILGPVRTDLNAEDILSRKQLAPYGAGAIQASGAPARLIDSRDSPEFLASRYGAAPARSSNAAGDFMSALLGMKQISGDASQRLAETKAETAARAAEGTYARGAAALGTVNIGAQLAAAHLKQHPGDFAGAAALMHGRTTTPSFGESAVTPPNPKTGAIPIINHRTGAIEWTIPKQPITLAQAIASAKKNKTYKSDAQVRTDLQNMPGYKLVD